jgi:TetR/AcrR family transcriptional repressor of nem operon
MGRGSRQQGSRPKLRTRQNDPQGMRARVLDVASSLFQSRGFHATSIHDVMQLSGVSGGALHHHFPTKKALALAVITDRVAPVVRDTWIAPLRASASLSKGIAGVFGEIIRGIEQRGSVAGCPLNNLALELAFADAELRDALQAIFSEWQVALTERIAQTPGGSRLDRAKRSAAAAFVISVYSGAMNMAKSAQSSSPLRSAASVLSQWLREREFAT